MQVFIQVHGERGEGKTRLLEKINNLLAEEYGQGLTHANCTEGTLEQLLGTITPDSAGEPSHAEPAARVPSFEYTVSAIVGEEQDLWDFAILTKIFGAAFYGKRVAMLAYLKERYGND